MEIKKAKQLSLRKFCHKIEDVPGSARLMKIMAKTATNMVQTLTATSKVSTIKLPDRSFTTRKGTLTVLFMVHFQILEQLRKELGYLSGIALG
jgi:hypothetical protein